MRPDLSICIANHKTPDLTLACLESIRQQTPDLTVEVLLVNNTPDDRDRLEAAVQGLPHGCFLQNEQPLSFAANQNQLMRRSRGRYLMPLNSDTLLPPTAAAQLVHFMETHPHCAIAGPRLVHADGSLQPSLRNFPTPLTHFLEISGLWRLLRKNRLVGRRYYLCGPHDRTQQADWLSGACLIVRADVAAQTGYYDDRAFTGMYAEDLDWCWRVVQAGWEVWFDAATTIVHLESQSPLDNRAVQMCRGLYLFCTLHYSRGRQRAMRLATVAGAAPRWLLARSPQQRRIYAALMALPVAEGAH